MTVVARHGVVMHFIDLYVFVSKLQIEEGITSRRLEKAFPNPGLVRIILLERNRIVWEPFTA